MITLLCVNIKTVINFNRVLKKALLEREFPYYLNSNSIWIVLYRQYSTVSARRQLFSGPLLADQELHIRLDQPCKPYLIYPRGKQRLREKL